MEILNLHAHIATAATDCDGPMYREYTAFISPEERAQHLAANGINDFTEIKFRERILASQVSVYSVGPGGLTMKADEHGFTWNEGTDEGSRGGEVRWCDDRDCGESYSQRDIYAEMMGY